MTHRKSRCAAVIVMAPSPGGATCSYIGPMSRRHEDDASDHHADDAESDEGAPVVPEAGEGPYPPVMGEPKPPIGN